MSLLLFLVFGFVIGLLARAIMPGRQHMGILMTTLLGVVGSFVGGTIASLIAGESTTGHMVHTAGLLGSLIGALLLLFAFGAATNRRRHSII
jgi:uncharacterized membrane protein YeaQ/YmgE (transglycosylase-associated protein family)